VSFTEKQAVVTYDPSQVTVEKMIHAVVQAGFQARAITKRQPEQEENGHGK
jgi:copper chaperone CopZ